jgi:hypothetical protein
MSHILGFVKEKMEKSGKKFRIAGETRQDNARGDCFGQERSCRGAVLPINRRVAEEN